MPPWSDFERAVQVFSQIEVDTTRKYGGTGLGLAISKSFAEMSTLGAYMKLTCDLLAVGGTMWCESEPGKGRSVS